MTYAISLLACALCCVSAAVICIAPPLYEYVKFQMQYDMQHANAVSESELFFNKVLEKAMP